MISSVREQVDSVQSNLGPTISEQNKTIEEWWRQLAEEYQSHLHHSFVRDVPLDLVTKLFVKKGIVKDEFNAHQLFKHDLGEHILSGENNRMMSREEFLMIFSKRMFRDALLQVTGKIQGLGCGECKD